MQRDDTKNAAQPSPKEGSGGAEGHAIGHPARSFGIVARVSVRFDAKSADVSPPPRTFGSLEHVGSTMLEAERETSHTSRAPLAIGGGFGAGTARSMSCGAAQSGDLADTRRRGGESSRTEHEPHLESVQRRGVKLPVLSREMAPAAHPELPLVARLSGSALLALLLFAAFLVLGFMFIPPGPAEERRLGVAGLALVSLFVANALAHALVCRAEGRPALVPVLLSGAAMALTTWLSGTFLGPSSTVAPSAFSLAVLVLVAALGAVLGVRLRVPARGCVSARMPPR
jgi:hypothetical protein